MKLRDEMKLLPAPMASCGLALVDLVFSLVPPGRKFRCKNGQKLWLLEPENFVGFTVQHARKGNFVLSLYGSWIGAESFYGFGRTMVEQKICEAGDLLEIDKGRFDGLTRASFDSPRQLAVAALYIQQAYRNYVAEHGLLDMLPPSSQTASLTSAIPR